METKENIGRYISISKILDMHSTSIHNISLSQETTAEPQLD